MPREIVRQRDEKLEDYFQRAMDKVIKEQKPYRVKIGFLDVDVTPEMTTDYLLKLYQTVYGAQN